MNWLALDIGGANIKLADGKGYAASYTFSMWKEHGRLAQELRTRIAEAPRCDHLAITMTGELADCFENRTDGVKYILQAVKDAADSRHTRVYLTNGMLVAPPVALNRVMEVAAANWHALANFAGRYVRKGGALLIDLGSTTCDVIPLLDGQPVSKGKTDLDRMMEGELVYTGVERSPICALVNEVPYRDRLCPVAQEVFATTRDAYLITGDLQEDALNRNTADGRPATKAGAKARLGRMIGADGEQINFRDAAVIADAVCRAQIELIASQVQKVIAGMAAKPEVFILSGQGEFLALRVLESLKVSGRWLSLSQELGNAVSRCGPAHALAIVARESVGQ